MTLGRKASGFARKLLSPAKGKAITQTSPIEWNTTGETLQPSCCPVCGATTDKLILRMVSEELTLALLNCTCGSVFYPEAVAPDYEVAEGREAFLMRVDQAEGVDSIIRSLLISPEIETYPVIDLGCGTGFAVDYSTATGRRAWGFDHPRSSRLSAEILGIDISGLPSDKEIEGFPHPNVVFASEVIEHVPDPRDFVKQVRRMTRDDGFAIFTTPSAEYVKEGNSQPTLFSILAPSQHLFLLSAAALQKLMLEAGYGWAHC